MPTVVVFSSSHQMSDPRVSRSIRVLARMGEVRAFLDERHIPQAEDGSVEGGPRAIPVKLEYARFLKLKFPMYRRWADAILRSAPDVDVIYLHEGGLVGLLLGSHLKKITKAKFFFDYHDSLEYELYYQLNKIGIRSRRLMRWYLRRMRPHIEAADAIIGVSARQLDQLFRYLHHPKPAIVIPNIRPYLESNFRPNGGPPVIVWIGNVKKINNIEAVLRLYGESSRVQAAKVFGEIDPDYLDALTRGSSKPIEFFGRYANDAEIQRHLSGPAICVLAEAPDPMCTELNEICSPNKVFSAINIGIPLLVHEKLKNVSDLLLSYRAGRVFGCGREFHQGLDDILDRYEDFRQNVIALKKAVLEKDYEGELLQFLRSLIPG